MKRLLALLLALIMVLMLTACGSEPSEEATSDHQQSTAEESSSSASTSPKRDLPNGDYEEKGSGSFYLAGPSGSTENGDEIVLYPEKDTIPHAYVDIELWDMDGSVQTYIYVDGIEMDKQQVGAGYQGSIDFDDESLWAITDGKHTVEAVQYTDNDPSKEMIFYRSEEYTVKNN